MTPFYSTLFFLICVWTSTACAHVKAIIFDCDGILVDTEEVLYGAWAYAFNQQGFELTKELYWQLMIENKLPGIAYGQFSAG